MNKIFKKIKLKQQMIHFENLKKIIKTAMLGFFFNFRASRW